MTDAPSYIDTGLIRFLTTFCWSVSVTNPCGSKKPLDSPLVKLLRVGKVARLVRAARLSLPIPFSV